jgi:predicted ribosome quality control (RQC) complex YloA/Tae2 family protein
VDNLYLSAVVKEIASEVQGRSISRASLSNLRLLIDLRLGRGRQLLVSMDRSNPALFITDNPASKLPPEKQAPKTFIALLRKHIFEAKLERISKEPCDRIVQMEFEKLSAGDTRVRTTLVLILTGRSGNAHLVDSQQNVIASLFERSDRQQTMPMGMPTEQFDPSSPFEHLSESPTQAEILDRFWGIDSVFGPQLKNEFLARCEGKSPAAAFASLVDDLYHRPPIPLVYSRVPLERIGREVIGPKDDLLLSHIELVRARGMLRYEFETLSEAANEYDNARLRATLLRSDYSALRHRLEREVSRREAAIEAIESDRARFKDPDRLKRFGDLILANLANATIKGSRVTVVDYYDPNHAEIDIEIKEGSRLQDAAADYFARYQKARRALDSIASRARDVALTLDPLKALLQRLQQEPTSERVDEVRFAADELLGRSSSTGSRARDRQRTNTLGRRFRSTDGYEIVVGRNDRENDALTFRVARPSDTWLHAADYPGSHVIIRNPSREPPPHQTIIEAAELAAFYSQAGREGKTAVHYTQKKFVSKPPRSKPGLVRLSSFKTAMVKPSRRAERLD